MNRSTLQILEQTCDSLFFYHRKLHHRLLSTSLFRTEAWDSNPRGGHDCRSSISPRRRNKLATIRNWLSRLGACERGGFHSQNYASDKLISRQASRWKAVSIAIFSRNVATLGRARYYTRASSSRTLTKQLNTVTKIPIQH